MQIKNIPAVILAAGISSRFSPYTGFAHKSLIKLMGKPIVVHTLLALKKAGVKKVIVVSGKSNAVKQAIAEEDIHDLDITYVTQEKGLGMGDALLRTQKYLASDFFLLNASHLDFEAFGKELLLKKKSSEDIVLLGKKSGVPERYGVVCMKDGAVGDIIEKPQKENQSSNIKIVGIYLLSQKFLETLRSTPLEHYNLEKALSLFARNDKVLLHITDKETVTLKYPWDIFDIKNYLFRNLKSYVSQKAEIDKLAEIKGKVYIEEGVKIMEGARIKGPCYLGKNVYIGTNSFLRNGVDIEESSTIGAYMEMKNTVLLEESTTHSGFIGDSIIGRKCKIAAYFCTGNVRLDRDFISIMVNGEKVNTERRSLGVFMGDNVLAGIRVSTMPGVMIGNDSIIGPSTTVTKNIEPNIRYYTKFKEFVETKKESKKKQKIVLFDIDYTLFDTDIFKQTKLQKHSVYNEVHEVLTNLGEVAQLGIFSEGENALQTTKLQKSGILKYFLKDKIHIVAQKEKNLQILKRYKDKMLFIIDDKLTILHQAKKILPSLFTIWLKRGRYAKTQKPIKGFVPNATIVNLQKATKIISAA